MKEEFEWGKVLSQPSTLQHEENTFFNMERLSAIPHNEKKLLHIFPSRPYVINLLENV